MCGEKEVDGESEPPFVGSPPRVRGKEEKGKEGKKNGRITPACAGKSFSLMELIRSSRDHPRVCGEKAEMAMQVYAE